MSAFPEASGPFDLAAVRERKERERQIMLLRDLEYSASRARNYELAAAAAELRDKLQRGEA